MKKSELKQLIKETIREETQPQTGYTVSLWLKNEDLRKFVRQATTDIYVGTKNGAKNIEPVVDEFLKHLRGRMIPTKVQGK